MEFIQSKLISETNSFIKNINIDSILEIVDIIKNSKNNIYIVGVGKNGPVSIYFSDVLKSINYSAFYLSCLNLTHGNIGCIKNNDTIIIISNSGNTAELINNIKYIHNKNKYLITTNKDAKLIKFVEKSFIFKCCQEIDGKFNLIPCTSIVNYMIIINFIVYYLMTHSKLTLKEYNYNHPKGNIGLLSQTVQDIIIPIEDTCYNTINNSIETIILNMLKYKVGYSCIIDEQNIIIGLITDHNIRINLNKHKTLNEIMTKNFKYIDNLDLSLAEAYKIPFLYIPVVINKKLIGMIKNITV
jgi:arabinose-5-phosphate isomerase